MPWQESTTLSLRKDRSGLYNGEGPRVRTHA
jgi:hypothetical protein